MDGPSDEGPTETDRRAREFLMRGDQRRALELLVDAYEGHVRARCRRIAGDRVSLDDLVQQVFLAAWRDIGRTPVRSFLGWLLGIAVHRALDAVKDSNKRAQRFSHAEEPDKNTSSGDAAPEERLHADDKARALEECINSLGPDDRAVVLLRVQDELPFVEMAKLLKVDAGTLAKRFARAMPRLRRCLESKGFVP